MSNDTIECPHCHAYVEIPEDVDSVTCSECGTVIEIVSKDE